MQVFNHYKFLREDCAKPVQSEMSIVIIITIFTLFGYADRVVLDKNCSLGQCGMSLLTKQFVSSDIILSV